MKRRTLHSCLTQPRRHGVLALTTAALGGLLFSLAGAGVASATPSHWQTYHDEWGPADSYCSVPGLTIIEQGYADGRFRTTTHGPDGQSYDFDSASFTDVWTNAATGEFVTQVGKYRGGTHQIRDNGDGTLTVVIKYTRSLVLYDQDGRVISRDPGLFTFGLLFDHAGTPKDPSDDVLLEVGEVKNTGPAHDLCTTLVQVLG